MGIPVARAAAGSRLTEINALRPAGIRPDRDLLHALGERVVLFDGAMGTMLLDQGLPLGTPPERWVLDEPETVLAVHQAYVAAGAEVVTTCTFGANQIHLARAGMADRASDVNPLAVELARAAAGPNRWVAGDIGPIWPRQGERRDFTAGEREKAYAAQARALASAGCDVLLIETMTDLDEAVLAITAVRDETPHPVIATMTLGPLGADRDWPERPAWMARSPRPEIAVARLVRAGATAVGVNCTLTARSMLPIVVRMVAATDAPLVVQPNAGQPRRAGDGRFRYDETPERFAAGVVALAAAGARAIGGCCGTTPAHIAAARAALEA